MEKSSIAIIGAGVAGLAAAAALSRVADVTVYERAAAPGGKIRQVAFDNARIDSGPTVFTLKHVFEDIFAAGGGALEDYVSLRPLHVLARHNWTDGARLDLFADKEESAAAIAAFAGAHEADNYLAFMKKAREVWRTLYEPFVRQPAPSLVSLMMRRTPARLMRIDPYTSYWKALTKAFDDPRLRQLFARYATYCGSSPFAAPATLKLIAHVEQEGVWGLEGGMQALANALESLARENGARFVYNAHIDEIKARNGAVEGLASNAKGDAAAPIVLFNGDVNALPAGAFPAGALGRGPARATNGTTKGTAKRPASTSQSAVTWSFLGDAAGADLSLHNVFFSDDYEAEFDAVFGSRSVPLHPTVYLYAPDRLESAQDCSRPEARSASPGETGSDAGPPNAGERFFCLINAPADGDVHEYTEKEISQCHARTFDQMKRCGVTLSATPGKTAATTPSDFARMFPATGGALFGSPTHGWRGSFRRPGVRTRLKGLYCAGGGVHPGSGAPMAALSGLMAARAIMKDFALT